MSARAAARKRNRSASSLRDRINRRRGGQNNPIQVEDSPPRPTTPSLGPSSVNPAAPSGPSGPSAPFPTSSSSRGILILGKQVGSGAFGSVVNSIYYEPDTPESRVVDYTGKPLQPRKHYAVKIQDVEETKIEIDILTKLGESPYIMKVYGIGNVPNRTDVNALVSDMYNQTLDNRIRKESIVTRRRNFADLTRQMFEAVAFLASKDIVHRDLHSGNIMFGSNSYGEPKIIDFGWSADTGGNAFVPFDLPDTEPYRIFHPPEQRVFAGGMYQYGMCTTKFDVYSMAVNLIELVYDSSKNRAVDWSGTMPRDFNVLMICVILKIPMQSIELAYKRYKDMDKVDRYYRREMGKQLYPDSARMVECSIMESQTVDNICSYFVEREGYVKLILSMPGILGEVLHDCLELDATRPTAAEAAQRLRGPSLSSDVMSSSAFLKLRF